MRKIISVLLIGTYLFLSMTVAALVWRAGAGWGASVAALMGTLGLATADRKSTRLNSSHIPLSRMPSSA